jgi:hypothetical protein
MALAARGTLTAVADDAGVFEGILTLTDQAAPADAELTSGAIGGLRVSEEVTAAGSSCSPVVPVD